MPPSGPAGAPGPEPEWHPPLVFAEYQLLWMLGRGGMGAVYLGHDKLLDRPVAIKFISSVVLDQKSREQYLTEARAAARLQHPNVVTIHRVGDIDDRLYIVTEYVRGQTLESLQKPIPWQQALELAVGLARGLAEAHRRGVLHRDLKPGNAILADTGEIKLLDFGLAKFLEGAPPIPTPATADGESMVASGDAIQAPTVDFTDPNAMAKAGQAQLSGAHRGVPGSGSGRRRLGRGRRPANDAKALAYRSSGGYRRVVATSSIKGTPMYMAPEVLTGLQATRRSDIYSMGALLFELAAGVPPYYDVALEQLQTIVPTRDAPPLSHIAPGIDPRFAAVIDRCLRRNPGERFATGEQLLEALEHIAPASTQTIPEGNPYRGLWPFEMEHRALYFGRRGETGTLIERLRSEPGVLISGDSGIGKSSLVRAGLLPLIQDGLIDGAYEWSVAMMTPGRQPLQQLISVLAATLQVTEATMLDRIANAPEQLASSLEQHLGPKRAVVILIDQLEELLTVCSPEEGRRFGRALAGLYRIQPRWRLLATLRSASAGQLAALPGIGDWLDSSRYLLRPLSAERLREIIVGPAHAKGFLFQNQSMVDHLVEASAAREGGLPLLALVLAELWEAREGNAITDGALAAIGGLDGSITRHADHVVGTMLGDRRLLARRLLCAIAQQRSGVTRDELVAGDPGALQVLDTLVRSRLLFQRAVADQTRYEFSHALLHTSWPTLRRWLSDPRSSDPNQPAMSASGQSLQPPPSRRRLLRWLLAGAGVAAAGTWAGLSYVAQRQRAADMAVHHRQADRELSVARGLFGEMQSLREQSLQAWIEGHPDDTARQLDKARSTAVSADRAFARAGHQLEAALHIDGQQPEVRRALADVLLERAMVAEAAQLESLQDDLLQRLTLHNSDGSHRQRWQRPARLSISVSPAGATVQTTRYAPDDKTRWVAMATWSLGVVPLPTGELEPGLYVLTVTAPGHGTVERALLLARGGERQLDISLPKLGSTP